MPVGMEPARSSVTVSEGSSGAATRRRSEMETHSWRPCEVVCRELSRLASMGLLRREGCDPPVPDLARLEKLVREAKGEWQGTGPVICRRPESSGQQEVPRKPGCIFSRRHWQMPTTPAGRSTHGPPTDGRGTPGRCKPIPMRCPWLTAVLQAKAAESELGANRKAMAGKAQLTP
jgi:hypothetical protein